MQRTYRNWGTVFQKSKSPPVHMERSSLQLGRDLGIIQKRGLFFAQIRQIKVPRSQPLENIIGVDETYVWGKFFNINR